MVFVNIGIKEIHKKSIRNEGGVTPTYAVFAGDGNTFLGTETGVGSPFINKALTWTTNGSNSKYLTDLTSLECIGSNITSFALIGSPTTGSPLSNYILFALNEAYIGSKNDTFNVQVEGEIIISRRQ